MLLRFSQCLREHLFDEHCTDLSHRICVLFSHFRDSEYLSSAEQKSL